MPGVSVVIPSYNAARFIGAAINSILGQSQAAQEVIVVDDGSTDATSEILAAFEAHGSLKVIRQQNAGPAAARNAGIAAAEGELIALMDADDIALPQRLALQAGVLSRHPELSVVSGGYEWIDETGQSLPWPYHSWRHYPDLNSLRTWLFDCPIVPSATMLRRVTWTAVHGFNPQLVGPEDWDFWMRLVLSGQGMAWNREVVCLYRRVKTSLSSHAQRMSSHSIKALEGIIERPDFPTSLAPLASQALALRYVDAAKRLFWEGAWEDGGLVLRTALHQDPGLLSGHPCRLEDELVSAAIDPMVCDPIAFLDSTFDHLPDECASLRARRGPVRLRCCGELFLLTMAHDKQAVRRYLVTALRQLPTALFDRGLWGGAWRAILNRCRRPDRWTPPDRGPI